MPGPGPDELTAGITICSDHTQTVEDMHLYVKVKASALLNQAAVLARDTARSEHQFQVTLLLTDLSIISPIRYILATPTGSQRQT